MELLVGHDGAAVVILLKVGEQASPLRLDEDGAVQHATNVLKALADLKEARCQAASRPSEDLGYRARPDIGTTTATGGTGTPHGSTPATDGDGSAPSS